MHSSQNNSRSAQENRFPWPHAPIHKLSGSGTFMVTAGTYRKQKLFKDGPLLRMLHRALLTIAAKYEWQLEAWAVFPNHYHFIGHSPKEADSLVPFLGELHSRTAIALNRETHTPGRKVWHNYWESRLTFEKSYFARLHYVHANPVRHGLVAVANLYPYCSAAWFERVASTAQVKTIYSFGVERLNVRDDF